MKKFIRQNKRCDYENWERYFSRTGETVTLMSIVTRETCFLFLHFPVLVKVRFTSYTFYRGKKERKTTKGRIKGGVMRVEIQFSKKKMEVCRRRYDKELNG